MKFLFIAYRFPPDAGSGSYRPMFFANHLVRLGHSVQVLAARLEDLLPNEAVDTKLGTLVDERIKVIRCKVVRIREKLIALKNRIRSSAPCNGSARNTVASNTSDATSGKSIWTRIKDAVTDILATPDENVGWVFDSVRQGRDIIDAEQPDIIFATGGPWSGLLAGVFLKKISGIPLIVDFRDPWTSNPRSMQKITLVNRINRFLERYVVRNANFVIANTDPLRDDFIDRYPFLASMIETITNGFEEYLPSKRKESRNRLTITHLGTLYFSRSPLNLLKAFNSLFEKGEIIDQEMILCFVGDIAINDTNIDEIMQNDASRNCIEVIKRVPYEKTMEYLQQSDVLLIIQQQFPLQVPRKIYEYMSACKPILCISEIESASSVLVKKYGAGYVSEDSCESLENILREIYVTWKSGKLINYNDNRFDPFLNASLTKKLAFIAENIIAAA